jgi:hypothetical protein
MGALGDLLERLHEARLPESFALTLHHRYDLAVAARAVGVAADEVPWRFGMPTDEPGPRLAWPTRHLRAPGRLRHEAPDGSAWVAADGVAWGVSAEGTRTDPLLPETGTDAFLAPTRLLGELEFTGVQAGEAGGRPALVATAHPRFDWEDEWADIGDGELELVVDPASGLVQRVTARLDGRPDLRSDLVELKAGVVGPDDPLFTPPTG